MTTTVDVNTVQLAELLALAKAGNEIILTEGDVPVARLTPAVPVVKRIGNLHPGAITAKADFDDPLAEEFWLGNS